MGPVNARDAKNREWLDDLLRQPPLKASFVTRTPPGLASLCCRVYTAPLRGASRLMRSSPSLSTSAGYSTQSNVSPPRDRPYVPFLRHPAATHHPPGRLPRALLEPTFRFGMRRGLCTYNLLAYPLGEDRRRWRPSPRARRGRPVRHTLLLEI